MIKILFLGFRGQGLKCRNLCFLKIKLNLTGLPDDHQRQGPNEDGHKTTLKLATKLYDKNTSFEKTGKQIIFYLPHQKSSEIKFCRPVDVFGCDFC